MNTGGSIFKETMIDMMRGKRDQGEDGEENGIIPLFYFVMILRVCY